MLQSIKESIKETTQYDFISLLMYGMLEKAKSTNTYPSNQDLIDYLGDAGVANDINIQTITQCQQLIQDWSNNPILFTNSTNYCYLNGEVDIDIVKRALSSILILNMIFFNEDTFSINSLLKERDRKQPMFSVVTELIMAQQSDKYKINVAYEKPDGIVYNIFEFKPLKFSYDNEKWLVTGKTPYDENEEWHEQTELQYERIIQLDIAFIHKIMKQN